jgi:5-oxoprolinase (ATP-hydrolysing) subunit C
LYGAASYQGLPKFGRRAFGVPPRGAFDQESLLLANAMLGNLPETPAIELGMGAFEATAVAGLTIAVVGAEAPISVNGTARPCNASLALETRDRLKIESPTRGARVYLSAPGGWSGHLNRGSEISVLRSSHIPAKRLLNAPSTLSARPIRVIAGPHADRYPSNVFDESFQVGNLIDRMGLRLSGSGLPQTPEIVSEPASFGTIQVANDGQLLILGPDGPTIGGYPKLAHVASIDLDRLGQLRPGDQVQFEPVEVEEARHLLVTKRIELRKLADLLRLSL